MVKKKTMTVNSYDWKITLKKFFIQFFLVAIIAALTWAANEGLGNIVLEYPEYTVIISLVTAVVIAVINYLKHYQDTEEIPV